MIDRILKLERLVKWLYCKIKNGVTEGSISSINGIPYLTGLVEANNNTDAKTYAKVGALYYDLTGGKNFITQIRP